VLDWKEMDENNTEEFRYSMLEANEDDDPDNDIIIKQSLK